MSRHPSQDCSEPAGRGAAGRWVVDDRARDALVRLCWGYLGRLHDAEDAAQEVVSKALKLSQMPEKPQAWLFRVARNHCLSCLRRGGGAGREQELFSDWQQVAARSGAATRLARHELHLLVIGELAKLPPALREVLVLRYVQGLSRDEVAEIIEEPVSVVRSRLFQALSRLRQQLEPASPTA